jgi:tRNA pseudouridine38-40 synthase
MRKMRLKIAYCGTAYSGWQRQKDGRGVQNVVEEAISRVTQEEIRVKAASRIDAGAHSLCQIVCFETEREFSCEVIKDAVNSVLPKDIVVLKAEDVVSSFNPRHAKERRYRYTVLNQAERSCFLSRYTYFYPYPLNLKRMQRASEALVGKHDFTPFASPSSRRPYREVKEIKIRRKKGLFGERLIIFDITGDSFLPHMIRRIVGTLIDVGRRKIQPEEIKRILEEKKGAGPAVPACGLVLLEVIY